MTPEEYRATIAQIGLSQVEAATLVGVDPRTSRRWALGEVAIPVAVAKLLRLVAAGRLTVKAVQAA